MTTKKPNGRSPKAPQLITHQGLTLAPQEWQERLGLSRQIVWSRIHKHGWSVEDAYTTKVIRNAPVPPKLPAHRPRKYDEPTMRLRIPVRLESEVVKFIKKLLHGGK